MTKPETEAIIGWLIDAEVDRRAKERFVEALEAAGLGFSAERFGRLLPGYYKLRSN